MPEGFRFQVSAPADWEELLEKMRLEGGFRSVGAMVVSLIAPKVAEERQWRDRAGKDQDHGS